MKTCIQIKTGAAGHLDFLETESIDLVVTSPPYPMIEMWDGVFAAQDPDLAEALAREDGVRACERMHLLLVQVWAEVFRVLKPGGMACINIGDATRTLRGEFRLYANHARILSCLSQLGAVTLPDILWRKPTNAPNKFMGSGMLPVGAYVTYEHEYILVARKGARRVFKTDPEQRRRRESAFFWEERNRWFSDLWTDLKGTGQELGDKEVQRRSAAFPFELAHRLLCMFSVKGDVVLDPFMGTGTTLLAAATAGRNAIGMDLDGEFCQVACRGLSAVPAFAGQFNRARLHRHLQFVADRERAGLPLKYANKHYGFPVVTAQERELLLNEVLAISEVARGLFEAEYSSGPLKL